MLMRYDEFVRFSFSSDIWKHIVIWFPVKPGYGKIGVSQGITPGVCDKQVCYVGRRYVDLDLVHNYCNFP